MLQRGVGVIGDKLFEASLQLLGELSPPASKMPVGGGPDDAAAEAEAAAFIALSSLGSALAYLSAPVLASADLAKIAKQIQAIQATQDGKGKHPAKADAAKPPLVPVQPKPARSANAVTATAPAQLAAAILAARTTAGLSQTALGAKLKMAQANIARLEKGGSIPSTTTRRSGVQTL